MRLSKTTKHIIIQAFFDDKLKAKLEQSIKDYKAACTAFVNQKLAERIKLYQDNKKLADLGYIHVISCAKTQENIELGQAARYVVFSVDDKVDTAKAAAKYTSGRLYISVKDEDFYKKINADIENINTALSQVESLVDSHTTEKSLVTQVPELDKYIPRPAGQASTSLVSTDLVNSVKALLA